MPVEQMNNLKQSLGRTLSEQCAHIRQRRITVEQEWLKTRRMWSEERVLGVYGESSNTKHRQKIPSGRRAIERTVVRTVQMLTPNVKWFETAALGPVADARLSDVDRYMDYIIQKRIKTRSNIDILVRCMVLYGRCFLRSSLTVKNNQVWPYQRVCDPFSLYVYPETVTDLDDADYIFEDYMWSYDRYASLASRGYVDAIKPSDLTAPNWPYHLTERLAYKGLVLEGDTLPEGAIESVERDLNNAPTKYTSITELWLTKDSQLYQVYILWNHKRGPRVVGFIKSIYSQPLFRGVIHRALPNEAFTHSMGSDIVALDAYQNDAMRAFLDGVDLEKGFAATFSANAAGQRKETWRIKGGAVWEMGDMPREALQFITPGNTSNNSLRAWQVLQGMVQSLAGTGTIAEGQPGRNMPRSGQAVGTLISLSMADIKSVAELIETEVLTPALGDVYGLSTQYIPTAQRIAIPGGKGLGDEKSILSVEDITGEYLFTWIGSLQTQEVAERAQRLMIFLNMAPQLQQMLAPQGYSLNIVELVKMIWRSGLGERGLVDIVSPLQQIQQSTIQDQQLQQEGKQEKNIMPGLQYTLPTLTGGFVQN